MDQPARGGDRLRQLRAFCHVARFGSISRAAEYMTSSQPAVSQQIRKLEEELGVALFERRGPQIVLTRTGEALRGLAVPLVQGMDRLPDTFYERHRGVAAHTFAVGVGSSTAIYLMPDVLKEFRERHPGIEVNMRIGTGEDRLDWLRSYEVDLVVAAMDFPPADLEHRTILESRMTLITPEDHPLAGRKSVQAGDVVGHPMVGHASDSVVQRLSEVIMRMHNVRPMVVVEVDGWNAIKRYVESGLGIAFVPDLCLTEGDRLWPIPIDRFSPPRKYRVISRRDGLTSLATDPFIRVLREVGSREK